MKLRLVTRSIVAAICLAYPVLGQDSPRLTEADVLRLAVSKIPAAQLRFYRASRPIYVPYAKAWQVAYSPVKKPDASGKTNPSIRLWVDDTTGNVVRSR
jgi:hypothetical protein